ncbi:MAG: 2-phosphosulfolactate phosphatase [Proteobacteria bacterium]|nr:2-phosphosulfolactate phosphatase [Pseudomonadota bacterium]
MCEWGADGAQFRRADVAIVVDVLSFSTCVSVAVDRGACIYPFSHGHGRARALADAVGATCAMKRGEGRYSLSPATLAKAVPGERIVLPSPNGAMLSLAQQAPVVFAGCLRNAKAVACAAQRCGPRILVAAAGERWPNGGLRVGFEDLIGAGAIIAELNGELTPEAHAARVVYESSRPRLAALLQDCASGQELIAWGFADDVAMAGAINSSATVPILRTDAVRYDEIMAVETDAVGAPLKGRQVAFYDAMAKEATAPI